MQRELLLPVGELIGDHLRLRRAVADGDVEVEADRVIGEVAREQLRQHGTVTANEEGGIGVGGPGQRGQRVDLAGQSAIGKVGHHIQGGQQGVFRSSDGQLLVG